MLFYGLQLAADVYRAQENLSDESYLLSQSVRIIFSKFIVTFLFISDSCSAHEW